MAIRPRGGSSCQNRHIGGRCRSSSVGSRIACVWMPRASSHSSRRLTASDLPAPPTPVTITTTERSASASSPLGLEQGRADLGRLVLVGRLVDLVAQLGVLEHGAPNRSQATVTVAERRGAEVR